MRISQALRPKEPRNFKATLLVCLVLLVFSRVVSYAWGWSPKRGLGLFFGILAAALFVFEMLYPARRPRAIPLFTAKNWLQGHVYLGVVASLAVLIHADFDLPRGGFGWLLLLLSLWTTATGLLGVWLQKWVPSALAEGLRVEALFERIPALVEERVAEADKLMNGASEVLERFYRTDVRPHLVGVAPSWSYLFDVRGGRDRALEPFRLITPFVEAGEREKVDDLMAIYSEKLELDAQYSVQRVLRGWPVLHAPPAGLLMALLVVHVLSWAWY